MAEDNQIGTVISGASILPEFLPRSAAASARTCPPARASKPYATTCTFRAPRSAAT
ncbi:hypothetical protein [Actinoplanes sp. GCM10030250]|uniref:hypothetical protein n=1 Tax=Actinoplanes sp. GCM10030250 TaxID=3273376 RepID=UPI00366C1818